MMNTDDYLDLTEQPDGTPVETPVAEVAPEETETPAVETTEEGAEGAEGEEKHKKPGSQRQKEARIRAEQMAQEAYQRAQFLEHQLAEIQAKINPVKADKEPSIDDFETLDEYVSAKANFVARKQLESYQYQQLEAQARHANQTEAQNWQNKVQAAIGDSEESHEAVQEFTYFAQQVERVAPAVANAAGQFIKGSDAGPELVIALGKDPELMRKLAAMSPYRAVAELGKLEDRILAAKKQPETKPKTNAPRPPEPVRSVPTATRKTDEIVLF